MGVGAPQDLAVEQPGGLDVRSVLGSPGYFIDTVGSRRALADDLLFNLGQHDVGSYRWHIHLS